jgi:hypothetical protein
MAWLRAKTATWQHQGMGLRVLAMGGMVAAIGIASTLPVGAVTVPPNSIPLTVVTSPGEPVVGVNMTAIDETDVHASPRGCGTDEITPTDASGQCTFYNMTPGHLWSIWLQGYPVTGSGDAHPAAGITYQPIVLKVTGRSVAAPPAHGGGTGLTGRALTSSGEYIPGIGVCATEGNPDAGVTCAQADAQGNFSVDGCCDVRVIGYLGENGGPHASESYVNGSVRHAPTGVPATLVVMVGASAISASPTATAQPSAAVTGTSQRAAVTGTLAQTGAQSPGFAAFLLGLVLLAGGLALRRPASRPNH